MTTTLSPQEIRRMLEQTLVPPMGVTELDPTAIKATTSRLGSSSGNVGESYHLDSGLTPAKAARLLPSGDVATVRNFFFTTAAEGSERMEREGSRHIVDTDAVAPHLSSILQPCWTEPHIVSALFGVDVLVVAAGALWRQVPGRQRLVFEATWDDDDFASLGNALVGIGTLDRETNAVIFFTGAFARVGFVHGARAYRSALVSAGMVAGALLRNTLVFGSPWRPTYAEDFLDRDLNRLLRNDGVDRGALGALVLSPNAPVQPVDASDSIKPENPA